MQGQPPLTHHPDGSLSITTAFNRRIAWREYGDPHGSPVLFLHGWPGSSSQGICLDQPARERHLRIIALDRPGFGHSSRIPDRSFLDLPPLAAAVMDALGVDRFFVFGVSGGGPYSLATAATLGHRIRAVLDCCGAPPLDDSTDRRALLPAYRFMLAINDAAPWLLRAIITVVVTLGKVQLPWPIMKLILKTVPPRDREALSNRARFDEFFPSFHGAMLSGSQSVFDDGQLYARPWPFDPATIQVPVRIWHGRFDNNFHWSLAQKLAHRIPGASFHLVDEGHYSLPAFQGAAMLDDLIAAAP